jgi:hypothetical protein
MSEEMDYWAKEEADALQRGRAAFVAGDVEGAVKAMADWIDARGIQKFYGELFEEHKA